MESQATKLAEYTNSLGWKRFSLWGEIKTCGVLRSGDGLCALAVPWRFELTVVELLALCSVLIAPSSFPVTSWGRISCDTCSVLFAVLLPQMVGCSVPSPFFLGHLSSVSHLAWVRAQLSGCEQ